MVLAQFFKDEHRLLDETVALGHFQQVSANETHLFNHLELLEKEFEGMPFLGLYHAALIVLIRREYKPEEVFQEFEQLWKNYPNELTEQLNLRWLVSAADTFMDYHTDPFVRSLMLNVSLIVNTVKIYETEHLANPTNYNNNLSEKLPLFEGLETFVLNRDDSLFNMRRRMDQLTKLSPHGVILQAVFQRLQNQGNAFSRLKEKHQQKRTQWW